MTHPAVRMVHFALRMTDPAVRIGVPAFRIASPAGGEAIAAARTCYAEVPEPSTYFAILPILTGRKGPHAAGRCE